MRAPSRPIASRTRCWGAGMFFALAIRPHTPPPTSGTTRRPRSTDMLQHPGRAARQLHPVVGVSPRGRRRRLLALHAPCKRVVTRGACAVPPWHECRNEEARGSERHQLTPLHPLQSGRSLCTARLGTRPVQTAAPALAGRATAYLGGCFKPPMCLWGASQPQKHQWSSGRMHRCLRCDPGSIPGRWCAADPGLTGS